jgi:hypothetical protein
MEPSTYTTTDTNNTNQNPTKSIGKSRTGTLEIQNKTYKIIRPDVTNS